MGELMDVIRDRRSIRRYQDKEIPEDSLKKISEAVRWAPSWNNTQCWEIVFVKDRAKKMKVQALVPDVNPAKKAILEAPVTIVLCGKVKVSGFYMGQATTKHGDWFMFDLGLAAQNLCLAAHDEGLGTVIVGLFDHDRMKEVLGIGEGYEVLALIPLGYPAKTSAAPKRREIEGFMHIDVF